MILKPKILKSQSYDIISNAVVWQPSRSIIQPKQLDRNILNVSTCILSVTESAGVGCKQRRNSSVWNSRFQNIWLGNQRQSPFLRTGRHTYNFKLLRLEALHIFFPSWNIIISWKRECNKTAYTDKFTLHLFLSFFFFFNLCKTE